MPLKRFNHYAKLAELTQKRMQKNGFNDSGIKLWTEDEISLLREHRNDIDRLCALLPHRTRCAIQSQCRKKVSSRQIHSWTAKEISQLRKLYPTADAKEISAVFSYSSWTNIQQVARYHGFRRQRKPYKLTGFNVLDQLRAKCFEIRWSMADLDRASRTKKYFQSMGWRRNKPSIQAVGKAVRALDGEIQIEWKD
ncbi:hypothetical protein [Ochrobactrum sp. AN78]|uniref:hypothetical protein n=1 Tax=Ochrobactrum sp. AN78 TaxID=3039853 RepID=UPI002989A7A9|nr:hypothetical protein [Ochrobactrum sp. AN78]MDH7793218.1 hypothetical protein [Ochrobactrum sp. AN78]